MNDSQDMTVRDRLILTTDSHLYSTRSIGTRIECVAELIANLYSDELGDCVQRSTESDKRDIVSNLIPYGNFIFR